METLDRRSQVGSMAVTRRGKWLITLAVIVALLLGARVALPYAVKDYVNRQLAGLKSYSGHVDEIDIHLWRGAYSIDGIEITKKGAPRPVPFFKADRVNFSVEWPSLWRGSLVSEASFESPQLNLVQGKTEQDSQLGKEENWNQQLENLFP